MDKRTDIWAFGCVLYELLTGRQAFQGETVTEILAAVLKGEPDWQALPGTTPSSIRVLLRRCLQKDVNSVAAMREMCESRLRKLSRLQAFDQPTVAPTTKLAAGGGFSCGRSGCGCHRWPCSLESETHAPPPQPVSPLYKSAAGPTIGRSGDGPAVALSPMALISRMSPAKAAPSSFICGRWIAWRPSPSREPKEPSTPSSHPTANGWGFSRAES